jgi:hypothetical protein
MVEAEINATAGGEHEHLLTLDQADRAVFRVLERDPGEGHLIDPGLERRGMPKLYMGTPSTATSAACCPIRAPGELIRSRVADNAAPAESGSVSA